MELARLYNLIQNELSNHDRRAATIVMDRYGLESEDYKTLAELGEVYDLTRERVRQIQNSTMAAIRSEIGRHKEIVRFLKFVHDYLDSQGGVRPSHLLVKDFIEANKLKDNEKILNNRLHFIAELVGEPNIVYEDDDWHSTWHNNERAYEKARAVAKHLNSFDDDNFDRFIESAGKKFSLPKEKIINYLHISKNFGIGPYGDLGAKHWVHINPKTTKDKNYIVLKYAGKPLHFREIAERVNKLNGVKPSHPDTVHNELIKDNRFRLVGRGLYALK
ncbi:MAG: hypothetical protein HYS87_03335 [Candidatus Colwellbacteria bacterium]|nr:hypothetical protein [Candidatus Colwellbacteria bacterium]